MIKYYGIIIQTVISRIGASYKKATSRLPTSSVAIVPIVVMASLVVDSFCSTSISCSLLSSIMLDAPTSTTHWRHEKKKKRGGIQYCILIDSKQFFFL